MTARLICGDALTTLRTLPAESVHCCVTSPPYFGLRDYGTGQWEGGSAECDHVTLAIGMSDANTLGHNGHLPETNAANVGRKKQYRDTCGKCGARRIDKQIGLEASPAEFVARLVEVFGEVRRVLRKDGTLWVNMGDSYGGAGATGRNDEDRPTPGGRGGSFNGGIRQAVQRSGQSKNLLGMPWRVAFALQDDGWILRSDIIWHKPNPMPESVRDRPTKSHEHLFLFAKSGETTFWTHRDLPGVRTQPQPDYRWRHKETHEERDSDPGDKEHWRRVNLWDGHDYFYDAEAIKEPAEYGRRSAFRSNNYVQNRAFANHATVKGGTVKGSDPSSGRNRRDVWTIASKPVKLAHFACFPPALVEPCVLAGTSERGCCPACGAPWVRVVERESRPTRPGLVNKFEAGHNGEHRTKANLQTRPETTTTTLGWQPSCSCPEADPVPAVVLDPFAGAASLGLVCIQHRRDFIGIELNQAYLALCDQRLRHVQVELF